MKAKQLVTDALMGGMVGMFTICIFLLLYVGRSGVESVNNSLLVLLVFIPAGSLFNIALKVLLDIDD